MQAIFNNYSNLAFYGKSLKVSKSKLDSYLKQGMSGVQIAEKYNASITWAHDTVKKLNGRSLKDIKQENITNLLRSALSDSELADMLKVSIARIKHMRCGVNSLRETKKMQRMQLIHERLKNGVKPEEIALQLGINKETVMIYIKQYKLNMYI